MGPLKGFRIIEVGSIGPGPFAGMMLAFGIVCALLEAGVAGKGQVVGAAIVEGTYVDGCILCRQ